jgi:pyruvate dehydrogenase E2 component (dihydrolipoamide acetyltransferase)
MAKELKLPDVGENIEKATVVKVMVEPGQVLEVEDMVIEIETDKASLEVPSDVSGKVKEVRVKEGEQIAPGDVILTVDEEGEGDKPEAGDKGEKPKAADKPQAGDKGDTPPAGADPIDLNDRIDRSKKPAQAAQPARSARSAQAAQNVQAAQPTPPSQSGQSGQSGQTPAPLPTTPTTPQPPPPAAPSVRRFAREIGVDIHLVKGSESGGRIDEEDVKAFARAQAASASSSSPTSASGVSDGAFALPNFEQWGEVRREKLSGIRSTIARRLSQSWRTIPHVHHFDEADITDIEAGRREFNAKLAKDRAPVTITAVLIKLCALMVRERPLFGASLDLAKGEAVLKGYCHIGVAVDTERGLMVPTIFDADQKDILTINQELVEAAQKARDGKLRREDMDGACFTITNLGGIGGVQFTPIINPPQVAILGVSRGQARPRIHGDKLEESLILPLSLGYDHRLIDGADAARFMRDLCAMLGNPALALFRA